MQKIIITSIICSFIWFVLVQPMSAEAKQKSERAALYWSLGTTLIPTVVGIPMITLERFDRMDVEPIGAVLTIGGMLIGPSTGHWYAGRHGRGWATVGVRFGLSVVGLVAAADLVGAGLSEGHYSIGEKISKGMLGAAALAIVSSIIYDIAAAPASAHHHNEKISFGGRM